MRGIDRGLTVIGLLIVFAVIGIALTVAWKIYQDYTESAYTTNDSYSSSYFRIPEVDQGTSKNLNGMGVWGKRHDQL